MTVDTPSASEATAQHTSHVSYRDTQNAAEQLLAGALGIPRDDTKANVTLTSPVVDEQASAHEEEWGRYESSAIIAFRLPDSLRNEHKRVEEGIQAALGGIPFIAGRVGGLKRKPVVPNLSALLESTIQAQPSAKDPAQGITDEEKKQLVAYLNSNECRYISVTPTTAATLTWNFESWRQSEKKEAVNTVHAEELRKDLQPRLEAIRKELIEAAKKNSPGYIPADKLAELDQLQVRLVPVDPEKPQEVKLEIGIESPTAKNTDGTPVMLPSAINILNDHKTADDQKLLEAIIGHAVTFAGENWLQSFGKTASGYEMKEYLKSRRSQITDAAAQKAIDAFLVHPQFSDEKEKSFTITPPDEKESTYKLRINNLTHDEAQLLFKSIISHAKVKGEEKEGFAGKFASPPAENKVAAVTAEDQGPAVAAAR